MEKYGKTDIMSLEKSRSGSTKSKQYYTTLHQVQKFKYVELVFASDKRQSKKIDTLFVEQAQYCMSFIVLWPQRSVQPHKQSCWFLNQFSSDHGFWLYNYWKNTISCTKVRDKFFAKSLWCDFLQKSAHSVKFVKPWMWTHIYE